MKVAVIDYNAGNIRSLGFALERLGVSPLITGDPEIIRTADKVIFPGVGEAGSTMRFLKNSGLDKLIPELSQPVLGICLGMQLLCSHSEERNTDCLGVFNVPVKKFEAAKDLKVPHMGWNIINETMHSGKSEAGIAWVYFVHSYYIPLNQWTTMSCDYGITFSAAMRKENFWAVQFHPEKSAEDGRLILESFLNS